MSSFILLVVSYFYLHNLTQDKTFDLYLKHEVLGDEAEKVKKEKTDKSKPQKLWSTIDIVRNGNVRFLIITEAFLAYSYSQIDLVITMTAVKTYQWNIIQFGVLTGVVVISTSISMYFVQKKLLGNGLNIYFLFVFCFVLISFFCSLLLLMVVLQLKSFYWQMLTLYIAIFCNSIQAFGSTAFSRWLIYSSTPSHSASIIESHRFMYCRVWASVGFFTSSYAFQWIWLVLPVTTCVSIIIVVLFVKKKDDYIKKK